MDDGTYSVGPDGLALPHPDGFVGSYYITYIVGAGMKVRIINVPGSDGALFREETEDHLCACGEASVYHFTVVDGLECSTYITMDSHEALHFMLNPETLLENPTHIGMFRHDSCEPDLFPMVGMLSGTDDMLIPAGEPIESVIADCVDNLGLHGADTDTFGDADRIKASEAYGDSTQMFADFQKLLEEENGKNK